MSNKDRCAGSPEAAAPTTPEIVAATLSDIHSTPTVHKQATTVSYSTGHVIRDETLIALGNEMVGYIVGPMPAREFLEFLPRNPRKAPSFRKKPFVNLASHKCEPAMYDPFVRMILFLSVNRLN